MVGTLPAGSALAARPREAIGELVASIEQKDQAPNLSKLRHLRRVKRVVKPLVAFAPAKLIAKKRAASEAKVAREAQLQRGALECAEKLPASIAQYISSSAEKHKVASADLAEEERRLGAVRAQYAGLDGSELAKDKIEKAASEVAKHRSHVGTLGEADRDVCEKLEAMVPSLEGVMAMLTPSEKRSFGDTMMCELQEASPAAAALPPTLKPVIEAVHTLVKMVPPPPPPPPPPSPPSPLTVSKKRSYSLLTQVADAAYSLLARSR